MDYPSHFHRTQAQRGKAIAVATDVVDESKSPSLHPSQIDVKIRLKAHNIASHTLVRKQDEWNRKLANLGVHVAPGKAPALKIKYGSKVATTRSWMTGNYTITIPKPKKGKTHRTAFYQEYSRALARISLDCIAQFKQR